MYMIPIGNVVRSDASTIDAAVLVININDTFDLPSCLFGIEQLHTTLHLPHYFSNAGAGL